MSVRSKSTNGNGDVDASCLSSNHKVMHYLQNSTSSSNNKCLVTLHKTSSHTPEFFQMRENPISDHVQTKQRLRCRSDNGSSSPVIETLSRSVFSCGSSIPDPSRHNSTFSSNTSSSGVCSTASDLGHEETTSTSSEELDFNLGFDQISDNNDGEIANLNEVEELDSEDCEPKCDKYQQNSPKNSADTATLRDIAESNLDDRISELEEFLRKSYSSSSLDGDDYHFNNDDTITGDPNSNQPRPSFLHDSTHTLCSQDRFSAYTNDDDHENEHLINGVGIRSNSLGIVQLNTKSALLDKAPKKVVRFADVLGLDLESIRYMTPPDQSTTSLIQECIRIKLEQLRLAKNQQSMSSSPFDLRSVPNRSSSLPTKPTRQYYLISKYFTSRNNIIPSIYDRHIMLECLYTNDSIAYGTVRVHNCDYDKRVFARVTENDWQTFHDIQAWHSMNYPDDQTDTFTFEIRLGKYDDPGKAPKQISFSVCLQTMGREFWDNNFGWNYFLDVLERC